MSSESVSMKQPIRKLEIPINKFNDVAIPHHLDLLRRHKENIKKFQRIKDWDKVHKEQINASRLVKQLEQLLYEMDTLRAQVENNDIEKFDKLTLKSRDMTINAIQEYLGKRMEPLILKMKFDSPSPSTISTTESSLDDDVNKLTSMHHPLDEHFIQLQDQQDDVERQEMCLHAWNSLQNELHQLHQLFLDFNKLILDQKEQVDFIENEVIESDERVREGTIYLKKASNLKVAAYPIAGALIGTCIGGPVGLIAGLKLGGLTAFGCGVLGFTGATILKKKHLESLKKSDEQEIHIDTRMSEKSLAINENLSIDVKKKL